MLQMKYCNDNIFGRMSETPLFSNLPESERRELMSELDVQIRCCSRGEVLTHECETASEAYVVLNGRILVYMCGYKDGRRHLAYTLQPGEIYGAAFPALEMRNNPGLLVPKAFAVVLRFKIDKIREYMKRGMHSAFIANLYAATAHHGFSVWRKLAIISCYGISDRVKMYMNWRHQDGLLDSDLPSVSEMAEYLCVNRTSLYRVLDKLKKHEQRPSA